MKTKFRLGDKVGGSYHGVAYTGAMRAYDGSGYLYVVLATPIVVYGVERTELAISPDSDERDSLRRVSRPDVAPAVRIISNAALGGACVA